MTTLTAEPRTIRALIDPDAISKVASFFDASITDIINELLQNARRAGARSVDVGWEDGRITVKDDGAGIADPQAILSFGGSNWTGESVDRERPAGMGFYSLARQADVRVASKRTGGAAWAVELGPGHFSGAEMAELRDVEWREPADHGTAVSFSWPNDPAGAIQKAARYYPRPVVYNGQPTKRQDFLNGALAITEWNGLRIGVHRRQDHHWEYPHGHGRCVNFHGIEVSAYHHLPEVETINNRPWNMIARVDVVDCPHLELTLPARKDLVVTPFLDELRDRCLTAIYHAIAEADYPYDVTHQTQADARGRGVPLPDARARLKPWRASTKRRRGDSQPARRTELPDSALVIEAVFENQIEHTLARAAEINGMAERLMRGESNQLRGYPWYDDLPKITNVTARVYHDGDVTELWLEDDTDAPTDMPHGRADRIELTVEVQQPDGHVSDLVLETDLALPDQESESMEDLNPVVTTDSDLDVEELTELLMAAHFSPSEDYESDSYDTQEEWAKRAASEVATAAVHSREEAFNLALKDALRRADIASLPAGSVVTATVGPQQKIDLTVSRPDRPDAQ